MGERVARPSSATRSLWVLGAVCLFVFVVLSYGGGTRRVWGYAVSPYQVALAPGLWVGWMMVMNYQHDRYKKIIATTLAIACLGAALVPWKALVWYYLGMLTVPLIFIWIQDYQHKS